MTRWRLCPTYRISGVPITDDSGKLIGILTNRDIRFLSTYDTKIEDVMTKDNLVTGKVGTTLDEAKKILMAHKIEKLPLVDDEGSSASGLITIKDIEKAVKYPNAAKDAQGRLLCAAAVGVTSDAHGARATRLLKVGSGCAGARHGARPFPWRARHACRAVKDEFPDLRSSSPATWLRRRRAEDADAMPGADCDQGWHRPRLHLHDARRRRACGVPQVTAIFDCAQASAKKQGIPVIGRRRHQVSPAIS